VVFVRIARRAAAQWLGDPAPTDGVTTDSAKTVGTAGELYVNARRSARRIARGVAPARVSPRGARRAASVRLPMIARRASVAQRAAESAVPQLGYAPDPLPFGAARAVPATLRAKRYATRTCPNKIAEKQALWRTAACVYHTLSISPPFANGV
jgi:hypothetical protein